MTIDQMADLAQAWADGYDELDAISKERAAALAPIQQRWNAVISRMSAQADQLRHFAEDTGEIYVIPKDDGKTIRVSDIGPRIIPEG